MGRVLWVVGEVIVGALLSGFLTGGLLPLATTMGLSTGPWLLWTMLIISIGACLVGGERLRKSLEKGSVEP